MNDSHQLKEILDRYRIASEEQDRAEAEARRLAEEEARLKAGLQKAWAFLQPRRKQVLEEINVVLRETGFQLQVFGESAPDGDGELESFKVKFTGRQHPQLDHVFLRISLRENGTVFVDVTGAKDLQRMRSLTVEEFTIDAWRDILIDHLATVAPREDTAGEREATNTTG